MKGSTIKIAKHIPNMIPVFRLITCFSLLGITQIKARLLMRVVFTVAYCVAGLTALTVAEDTYILLTSETYNVNHKGILFEKKGK